MKNNYNKKKFNINIKLVRKILLILQAVLSIVLIISVVHVNLFPIKYILLLVFVLMIAIFGYFFLEFSKSIITITKISYVFTLFCSVRSILFSPISNIFPSISLIFCCK